MEISKAGISKIPCGKIPNKKVCNIGICMDSFPTPSVIPNKNPFINSESKGKKRKGMIP